MQAEKQPDRIVIEQEFSISEPEWDALMKASKIIVALLDERLKPNVRGACNDGGPSLEAEISTELALRYLKPSSARS